jgi:hypothetical protein
VERLPQGPGGRSFELLRFQNCNDRRGGEDTCHIIVEAATEAITVTLLACHSHRATKKLPTRGLWDEMRAMTSLWMVS